jgi:hypothetical protein
VNLLATLVNRWQQHRVFALQQKGIGWAEMAGAGKRGLLSSLFHPPTPDCCIADLGGLLQSRGRDNSRSAAVSVVYAL